MKMKSSKSIHGSVFKSLRLNKGFSIKEIAKEGLSSSTISKFENGKLNLSLDNFFELLSLINISPQEYFSFLEDYEQKISYTSSFNLCFNQRRFNYFDLETFINKLKREKINIEKNSALRLQIISLEAYLSQKNPRYIIQEPELLEIKKYLTSIKIWGEFELILYFRTVALMDLESVEHFTQRLLDPLNFITYSQNYHLYFFACLVNVTDRLIILKDAKLLPKIEKYVQNYPLPDNCILFRLQLNFNFSMYHYYLGEKESAKREMNEIVHFLKRLGLFSFALIFEKKIDKL